MTYIISLRAAADLQHIAAEGLQRFGANQAAAYIDGMNDAFRLIAAFPASNRARQELSPELRISRYGAHVILYTIEGDAVRILRIRHGREDWLDE